MVAAVVLLPFMAKVPTFSGVHFCELYFYFTCFSLSISNSIASKLASFPFLFVENGSQIVNFDIRSNAFDLAVDTRSSSDFLLLVSFSR